METIVNGIGVAVGGFFGLIVLSIIGFIVIVTISTLITHMVYKMTFRPRQRKAILNSLKDSEQNVIEPRESLYKQYVDLGYGLKNINGNKLALEKYKERITFEYNRAATNPNLEKSKTFYIAKYASAIKRANKKSTNNDTFDITGFNHVDIPLDFAYLRRCFEGWDINLF